MINYYTGDIIPIILKRFKVNNVIISGLSDEKTINHILEYCNDFDADYIAIDPNSNFLNGTIQDYTLNILPDLKDFDAIFLNDDPNWYTVYNELKLIKENNSEFPLVFICNNVFPNKRKDSYINPKIIPKEFRNEYSKELILDDISIKDNFYHAINENTPNNGVLTAIEDFLSENSSIGIMDFKLDNGIIILYPKQSISQIRLGLIADEISEYSLNYDAFSDSMHEIQVLTNYIAKFGDNFDEIDNYKKLLDEKVSIIQDYSGKIELQDAEIDYKDTKIKSYDAKLNLKDSQIKNIESKLFNRENEISNLNNKLKIQIQENNKQLNEKNSAINFKDNQLKLKEKELNDKEILLDSIKQQYVEQLSKLDTKEYCISCFKEEIMNNHLEIQYLKSNTLTKKILNPLSYIYLIFKSNPKELSLNFKLYKLLKNSACFDIGYYLNNYEDIKDSKWCKFFSPELHYVCNGFNEKRNFNKKYYNRNSKKALLEYIKKCS